MKLNILINHVWRGYGFVTVVFVLAIYAATSCNNYPLDEDNLLITKRGECYVSDFDLRGVDMQTVRIPSTADAPNPNIDTVNCKIEVRVHFGTDLKNLYPVFSLVTDAKLEPKVTGLTDFSSLSKQWTVVSGNRKVRKTYTVNLIVQTP